MPPRPGHEPLSEQRLAIGGGNTSAPPRRPGRCTRLERGLDGGGDEPCGLRVDDDVPAEQNAADDLPGVRGRVVRADGGLGHTRTVEEMVLVRLPDTPDLQRLYDDPRAAPARRAPPVVVPLTVRFTDRPANWSRCRTAGWCHVLWDDLLTDRSPPPPTAGDPEASTGLLPGPTE